MFRLGLPVPHGFVLSTDACRDFYQEGSRELSETLVAEIERAVKSLEGQTGKLFGSVQRSKDNPNVALPPLMLSIRTSPAMHISGLSETVLDLGLNSLLVNMLTREFTNHRWIYDVYLRCLAAYGTVVQQIDPSRYDDIVHSYCEEHSVENISFLPEEALKEMTQKFRLFTDLPEDPMQQLHQVIKAFYQSWNSVSAVQYRRLRNISNDQLLGVIIQSMVHGDFNDKSGAGIAYTRNPNTGIKELYGEFLMKAVGDDVLRGNRNPLKLEQLYNINPQVYDRLINVMNVLEQHYRDVQVIFTIYTQNKGSLIM
ncbi:hypothetical protein EON65_15685 [archaeon]|nr:MAG: hypothetical protein EON65_15685 [archaeon]